MSRASQARSTAPARVGGRAPALAPPAREVDAAKAPDQRRGPRREPRTDRAEAVPAGVNTGRNWIPRRWPYLILSMIAAIGSCMVATRSMPGAVTATMLVISVAGAACVGQVHAYVAQRGLYAR